VYQTGGGGLRILPHKKWNPYNFDNIDKVRKDEEEHNKIEDAKKVLTDKQEALYRLEMLRKRSRQRFGDDEETLKMLEIQKQVEPPKPETNINLFTNSGPDNAKPNKDYEDEKKETELASLKKVIPELFFGQSALDAKGRKPWYSVSPEEAAVLNNKQKREKRAGPRNSRQTRSTSSATMLDPLTAMKSYLDEANKHEKDKLKESKKLKEKELIAKPRLPEPKAGNRKRDRDSDGDRDDKRDKQSRKSDTWDSHTNGNRKDGDKDSDGNHKKKKKKEKTGKDERKKKKKTKKLNLNIKK